jgi:hypothetical protein
MLMRKLALSLALPALLSVAGCKCCGHGCSRPCESPALVNVAPAPCNNCGGPPGPGPIVTPPPPGAVPGPGGGPAFYPPGSGPFGASGRKI